MLIETRRFPLRVTCGAWFDKYGSIIYVESFQPAMEPVLEAEGVCKSFWGVQALDGARLCVRKGEIHAITGENGAGKSTLMKIISGIERADEGEVRFSGRGIAMIHQELLPFSDLNVAENICMGQEPVRRFGWLDKPAMHREARSFMDRLGVPVDPARRMRDLSFAEQQSVEIAKALRRQADLIIMDEPTSALSARESERLFDLIRDLKSRGVAIIYISHRMQEVFRLADTVTVMRDGRHVATRPAAEFDEEQLIQMMVGRALDTATPRRAPGGEVVLEVVGLTRPGRFRGISFCLRRGEILGVAGLIGAGRSDLASAIYGLAPATAGEIRLHDGVVRIESPADALSRGIAMVTEDRKGSGFVPDMSIQENLTLSCLRRYCRGPFLRRGSEAAAAEEQIRLLGVRASGRTQPVKNLSGGNQQKVVLARALLTNPEVLILDEPTRGIDVGAKSEIYSLIRSLANEGKAILLISSDMNELLLLSSRILVMREGSVTAEVQPGSTAPEEILRYAMPN